MLPGAQAVNVREVLSRDHARLDTLFTRLLEQFAESDAESLRAMWARFEAGLLAHLAAEERQVLPLFEPVAPEEAAALRQDHAHFRRWLEELGLGVDLRLVRLEVAEDLIDALRAHAHREDRLMYRWAERELGDVAQRAVARTLVHPERADEAQEERRGARP